MGTDNDRIHVCVRLKKDEEDYLCGIASVRISDGITICGIRIYYCRGRLSVVYPCLVKENKRLPVLVLGKAEKERLTALILDAFESEKENGYGVKEETGYRNEGYHSCGNADPRICDGPD